MNAIRLRVARFLWFVGNLANRFSRFVDRAGAIVAPTDHCENYDNLADWEKELLYGKVPLFVRQKRNS